MMYEELVKSIRSCFGDRDDYCDCDGCYFKFKAKDGDYIECVDALGLAAADAIEELSKPKWIPVTERLPELGEIVIVYTKEPILTRRIWLDRMVISSKNDTPYWANHNGCVLYWMPLPEPPEEGE